jgi:hypothetical protein
MKMMLFDINKLKIKKQDLLPIDAAKKLNLSFQDGSYFKSYWNRNNK